MFYLEIRADELLQRSIRLTPEQYATLFFEIPFNALADAYGEYQSHIRQEGPDNLLLLQGRIVAPSMNMGAKGYYTSLVYQGDETGALVDLQGPFTWDEVKVVENEINMRMMTENDERRALILASVTMTQIRQAGLMRSGINFGNNNNMRGAVITIGDVAGGDINR